MAALKAYHAYRVDSPCPPQWARAEDGGSAAPWIADLCDYVAK